MRDEVRQALIDGVPEVEGRIFEPHTAAADTPKPYLIVKETSQDDDVDWAGFRQKFEVWPYVEESSYTEVDALAKKINDALDKKLLSTSDGSAFTCMADGMLEDVADKEWQALTRCVNFFVLALQPAEEQGPVINDPWAKALSEWTGKLLGTGYSAYSDKLPVGYMRPAVLWRVDTMSIQDCGALAFDVRKKVVCHVFGRNVTEETAIASQLIEEMGNAVKIPISLSERRYMTLIDVAGRFYTDALKQGHITAMVSRKTKRPREEAPLMAMVGIDGHIEEKEGV